MTKILNYNQRISRYEFIDGNQVIIGTFTPVDENYKEILAKFLVAKNVMDRLGIRFFYQPRPLEMRLVKNEGKIVGTFKISRSFPLDRECKPCVASPAAQSNQINLRNSSSLLLRLK